MGNLLFILLSVSDETKNDLAYYAIIMCPILLIAICISLGLLEHHLKKISKQLEENNKK